MARKKSKVVKKPVEEDEEMASSSSEAEETESENEEMADGNEEDSEEEASNSGSDSEEGEGSSDEDEDGSGSDEESEDNDNEARPTNPTGNEQCTFDLANLLAINTHQINAAELYSNKKSTLNPEWYPASTEPTISASSTNNQLPPFVNESFLLSKAAEGTTQLLAELWKLPSEKKSDVGLISKLPGFGETKLPRALPPPPPKQLTKWEQFALQRGIAPKSKRSRKVFDEATGEWKYLTGSLQNKANAGPESWPIMEVKKNDDPMADPWEKLREEKKSRVTKNTEARMRNAERAGMLERGSANKMVKNNKRLEKQRDIAKEKERKRGLIAPVGVPVDAKGTGAMRGKPSTQLALRATQVSTASLGKFDKQREGEPEKKQSKSLNAKKRKQIDGAAGGGGTNKKFLASEAQKSVDILQKVMTGGSASKERERDIKRGKYAKGETAYDYEFDDGLGAGSFKKKKGRAGMGKMKKMTKKRIK